MEDVTEGSDWRVMGEGGCGRRLEEEGTEVGGEDLVKVGRGRRRVKCWRGEVVECALNVLHSIAEQGWCEGGGGGLSEGGSVL